MVWKDIYDLFGRDADSRRNVQIQILRNVPGDESESLYEIVWLVDWILIYKKLYKSKYTSNHSRPFWANTIYCNLQRKNGLSLKKILLEQNEEKKPK